MKESQKELYKIVFEIIVVLGCILILMAINDENLALLGL